jgi:hypothetical protein
MLILISVALGAANFTHWLPALLAEVVEGTDVGAVEATEELEVKIKPLSVR